MNDIHKGCSIVLLDCLGITTNETVLIVTDKIRRPIGQALIKTAHSHGLNAEMVEIPITGISGTDPPDDVAKKMQQADVVVCPTTDSLTHTNARINACKNGCRVATMPGITEDMFTEGPLTADYLQVEKIVLENRDKLSAAESARILTDGGKYELIIPLGDRSGVASTGVYREKGQGGNLPSGEAYIPPIENTSQGTLFVDGSIAGMGKLKKPVIVTVIEGMLARVDNPDVEHLVPDNHLSRTLCEFGIGCNPKARVTGVVLEDEKIYGSIHIAFGTNTSFGGIIKAKSHIDFVTLKPEIFLTINGIEQKIDM